MTLSLHVQFWRNFFCVVEVLIPKSSWLLQPMSPITIGSIVISISLMRYLIASTQFYAVWSNVNSGLTHVIDGYLDYHRFAKMVKYVDKLNILNPCPEVCVVRHGVVIEKYRSVLKIVSGFLEVVIGICFIFLFLGSLEIHGPTHPKPIIDALIAMDVALIYFLVMMWESYTNTYSDKTKLSALAEVIKSKDACSSNSSLLSTIYSVGYDDHALYAAVQAIRSDETPAWLNDASESAEVSVLKELEAIKKALESLVTSNETALAIRATTAVYLQKRAESTYARAPLELVYFLLNVVAGYGYMLGILTFYFPVPTGSTVPTWLRSVMFGLSPAAGEFWGTFAGDFAWTVEPLIILVDKSYQAQTSSTIIKATTTATPTVAAATAVAATPSATSTATTSNSNGRNEAKEEALSTPDSKTATKRQSMASGGSGGDKKKKGKQKSN